VLGFVIHHIYIKACTPKLNGKVELFHKTDDVKFYKMLSHTEDIVNIVAVLNQSRSPVKGPSTSNCQLRKLFQWVGFWCNDDVDSSIDGASLLGRIGR
jgi:hypothetical protein